MGIEQIVEQVVSQVLESHVPKLREALVQRVLDELAAHPDLGASHTNQAPGSNAASLLKAISHIHEGSNQKEILRALLDGTTDFSSRSALFVVKAGAAVGWQGQGFSEDKNSEIKDFPFDVSGGLGADAMRERTPAAGDSSNVDANFIANFGAPANNESVVLPLLLKDKVAALVYADGGANAGVDKVALQLVVAATSAWLEVVSLRKQAVKETAQDDGRDSSPVAQAASPAYSDPFAGHAPAHTAPQAVAEAIPAEAASAAAAGASGSSVSVGAPEQLSPEDADTHRKAQRFARLLIDEIKLYNQAKVTEGRKHKDIYDRLKPDIEKSRSMYTKRYGKTAAASVDYFSAELVRSLAEDDSSLMGENFQR
ncbi:MAG TPA: hypothetical protein VN684_04060 [Terriglobales bacterium]|nr:hypothetical protein [Terriglobales bacterium]